ncbi:MAG: hypothetical protein Q8L48_11105, partial [Archangium sp.]|nr:hypothetical protein [Archangium sp.]
MTVLGLPAIPSVELHERHFEVMFNAGINRVRVTEFEFTARAMSRTSRAQRTRWLHRGVERV